MSEERVEEWLASLECGRSTQRRYFDALRGFAKFLKRKKVLAANPLADMVPPKNPPPKTMYFDFTNVRRVLDAMPDGESKRFVAVAFATGMERTALLAARVADVNIESRAIYAHGTKNASRSRPCFVASWAWPLVVEQLRGKLPTAQLFSVGYDKALDDFYEAQIAAGLVAKPEKGQSTRRHFHTLHDCRHSYAVNRLTGAGGEPAADIQFVADQLGHYDTVMVSRIYGKYRLGARLDAERAIKKQWAAAEEAAAQPVTFSVTAPKRSQKQKQA